MANISRKNILLSLFIVTVIICGGYYLINSSDKKQNTATTTPQQAKQATPSADKETLETIESISKYENKEVSLIGTLVQDLSGEYLLTSNKDTSTIGVKVDASKTKTDLSKYLGEVKVKGKVALVKNTDYSIVISQISKQSN